jgi:hypothetical protein
VDVGLVLIMWCVFALVAVVLAGIIGAGDEVRAPRTLEEICFAQCRDGGHVIIACREFCQETVVRVRP